jgi:hypothetical protein
MGSSLGRVSAASPDELPPGVVVVPGDIVVPGDVVVPGASRVGGMVCSVPGAPDMGGTVCSDGAKDGAPVTGPGSTVPEHDDGPQMLGEPYETAGVGYATLGVT